MSNPQGKNWQNALNAAREFLGQSQPRNDRHMAVISDSSGNTGAGVAIDVFNRTGFMYAVLGGVGGQVIQFRYQHTGHAAGDIIIVEQGLRGTWPYIELYWVASAGALGLAVPSGGTPPTLPGRPHYALVDPAGNGDFTTLNAALAAITSPAAGNQWYIDVMPGSYAENITLPVYTTVHSLARGGAILTGSGHTGQIATLNGENSILDGFQCVDLARADSNDFVRIWTGARLLNSVVNVQKTSGAVGSGCAVLSVSQYPDNGPVIENCTVTYRSDTAGDTAYAVLLAGNGSSIIDVSAQVIAFVGFGGTAAAISSQAGPSYAPSTVINCRTDSVSSNAGTTDDISVTGGFYLNLLFCKYSKATAYGGGAITVQQPSTATAYGLMRWDQAITWAAQHIFNLGIRLANMQRVILTALAGNNMSIAANSSNQLELIGGSSGSRVLNNAGSRSLWDLLDSGEFRINGAAANGEFLGIVSLTELLTIAAAATTDTAFSIPANCVVFGVPVRTTVAVPTAVTYTVTGATSGTVFNTAAVGVGAGSTDPGIKSCPFYNASAQKVRITPSATPGANTGRVRVGLYYYYILPQVS